MKRSVKVGIGLMFLGMMFYFVVSQYFSSGLFEDKSLISKNFPLKVLWTMSFKQKILTTPSAGEGFLFIRTQDNIYAVDIFKGNLLWSTSMTSDVDSSPPQVINNYVVSGNTTSVKAFYLQDGQLAWENKIQSFYDATILAESNQSIIINLVGNSVDVYNISTGKMEWSVQTGRGRSSAYIQENVAYLIIDGNLQVRDLFTGQLLDEIMLNIATPNVLNDGILYYRELPDNIQSNSTVVAFDLNRKNEIWRKSINDIANQMRVSKNHLAISTQSNLIIFNTITGEEEWATTVQGIYQAPILTDEYVFAKTSFTNRVYAFLLQDGTEIGYLDLGGQNFLFANMNAGIENWKNTNNNKNFLLLTANNQIYVLGDY